MVFDVVFNGAVETTPLPRLFVNQGMLMVGGGWRRCGGRRGEVTGSMSSKNASK